MDGGWEYRDFTLSLGETEFKDNWGVPFDGGAPTGDKSGSALAATIDRAVMDFLNSSEGQGWEPTHPFDGHSLWRLGRVDSKGKSFFIRTGSKITLHSVRISCRRPRS